MRTLNLGILAHVDAGKTSLTERLLQAAGVIDEVGSVDAGSTRTDSLDLERRRGITIKSAVVSFALGDATVNLIDTPGHPDFIAEVERVLNLLDGAVLVVSAVEGVQAQTRVLYRALRRLGVPTVVFVNKIDRAGARTDSLLRDLAAKLDPAMVAMDTVDGLGTARAASEPRERDAAFAEDLLEALLDDDLLDAYLADAATSPNISGMSHVARDAALDSAFEARVAKARAHPVHFGSAITGAGVDGLIAGIRRFLPGSEGDATGPLSGTVFKVERGPAGERIAYARLFSGAVAVRDRVPVGGRDAKVTGISVFEDGVDRPRARAEAGRIAKFRGLGEVRIGDAIGQTPRLRTEHFLRPALETVVAPVHEPDRPALHAALTQLAEQDPLIGLRHDEARRELSVSLYGEVQKEVVGATLAEEYGLEVEFRESTVICVERVTGTGAAAEFIAKAPNPFLATVGLAVASSDGPGIDFRLGVELGSMPFAFFKAVEETVHDTLREGLHGWQVEGATVTMTHSGYWARQSSAHGGFDKSMSSTAGDFRNLVPLVLMEALREAGTVVCEPLHRFRIELPAADLGGVLAALAKLRAVPEPPEIRGGRCALEGTIPAEAVHGLGQRLPGLTSGEGVLESVFERHEPVSGLVPARPRTDANPLDREAYLLAVSRRVTGA
ncbi:GTP-binding protein [Glycomyces lechevalierae]|uniref:Ribosomal protection tetracycline resistance protein n=1 Tax=Glycomyces lechevalierae TaxID=256034 RepID=A0A9X3SW42_9ACTN|nr:TetM/TetW/TetO/TetS family tetracycline resistance ribosomal protection protein [Glycomyces lechevalierae]MDA1383581.1 TetM/TetW/TetO/TetS family tetracycline resistance ribosomal protection protein [Glycomyces lechevalierae]MDR7341430.1 ribosomal protection tetracycline resistance protein [Glycomyces lechevalierae]